MQTLRVSPRTLDTKGGMPNTALPYLMMCQHLFLPIANIVQHSPPLYNFFFLSPVLFPGKGIVGEKKKSSGNKEKDRDGHSLPICCLRWSLQLASWLQKGQFILITVSIWMQGRNIREKHLINYQCKRTESETQHDELLVPNSHSQHLSVIKNNTFESASPHVSCIILSFSPISAMSKVTHITHSYERLFWRKTQLI